MSNAPPEPPDPYGSPPPPPPGGGYPPPGGYPPQGGNQGYGPPPGYGPPSGAPGSLAEWPQRALGWLIDAVPLLVINVISRVMPGGIGLLFSLLGLGYGIFLAVQLGQAGSTPGMRVIGLRAVSKSTGQPIGAGMGIARALAHIVDSVICLVGWLFPLWDKDKQTLADKIVGTVVVTAPKQGFSLTPTA